MKNYLLPSLEAYFEEICSLSGKLHVVGAYLPDYCQNIIKRDAENRTISSSISMFRDLSFDPNVNNLFSPNYDYSIDLNSLENEIESIVSRESCITVAMAYEVFESFYYQILIKYLINNQEKLVELNLLKAGLMLPEEEIKRLLKKHSGKNSRGLISLTKKISGHFKKHESKNCFSVNIFHWFDLLSEVRHVIIHNRQEISKTFLDYLEKNKSNKLNDLFNLRFGRKEIDKRICVFLTANQASDIVTWLNSFAHYVFKSISIDEGLSCKIPIYIPKPFQCERAAN